MPPCHGGDRQFKSDPGRQCGSSSVVEHNLAKVGVAGSSPVFRSIWRHSQAVRQRSAKPLSPVRFRVPPPGREKRRLKKSAFSSIFFHAGVAELADAGDLKSPEGNTSYRFEPGPRHQKNPHSYSGNRSCADFLFRFFTAEFFWFSLLSTPFSAPDRM